MNASPESKPEFWYLSEGIVLAGLQNSHGAVAAEVVRLVVSYTRALRVQPEGSGPQPRWPIESVALRLATALVERTDSKP